MDVLHTSVLMLVQSSQGTKLPSSLAKVASEEF